MASCCRLLHVGFTSADVFAVPAFAFRGTRNPWPGFWTSGPFPDAREAAPRCVRRGFSDDDVKASSSCGRAVVASEKRARNQPGSSCGSGTASRPSGSSSTLLQVSTSSTSKHRASGRVAQLRGACRRPPARGFWSRGRRKPTPRARAGSRRRHEPGDHAVRRAQKKTRAFARVVSIAVEASKLIHTSVDNPRRRRT